MPHRPRISLLGGRTALTLWGVEYDADGNLTTMWLTDSDDYEEKIFSVSATLDREKNKIYLGDKVVDGDRSYYLYDGMSNVFIGEINVLNTDESSTWRLVPEPTTATLSLLALAGLAARRRRK